MVQVWRGQSPRAQLTRAVPDAGRVEGVSRSRDETGPHGTVRGDAIRRDSHDTLYGALHASDSISMVPGD